jgi:hypothetical protein
MSHFLQVLTSRQPENHKSFIIPKDTPNIAKRFLNLYGNQNCKMNGYRHDCPTFVAQPTYAVAPVVWQKVRHTPDYRGTAN